MHGLGNDFLIIDARREAFAPGETVARRLGDRHRGVGFDQLIVIEEAREPGSAASMRFFNPDGGESGACGNGSRCIAWLLAEESGARALSLDVTAGTLACAVESAERVTVDMGPPELDWDDVPLAEAEDTLSLPLTLGPLSAPAALSMGNPHATFFVADAEAVDLESLGPALERHPLFPERANIGVAALTALDRLRLRVWERGAGLTLACGSGACAAAVNAVRRGLTGQQVTLDLDGGQLEVNWRENDGHVLMTGPTALAYEGQLPAELLA